MIMDLSPKQIVNQLDKYIIGQDDAKKAVAIALRNRYRRAQLPAEVREEITPKNIIMKGPTGVGKTEIARRLAKLVKAPFVKVEATKYTEVGYVGKDVEGMIRDLAECAYRLVKSEKEEEVRAKATDAAEKRILRVLTEIKKEDRGATVSDRAYNVKNRPRPAAVKLYESRLRPDGAVAFGVKLFFQTPSRRFVTWMWR